MWVVAAVPACRCVNRQGDKGGFNGGQALVGNFFDLLAVPDSGEEGFRGGDFCMKFDGHILAGLAASRRRSVVSHLDGFYSVALGRGRQGQGRAGQGV